MFKIFVSLIFVLIFMVSCGRIEVGIPQNINSSTDIVVTENALIPEVVNYEDESFQLTQPFVANGHSNIILSMSVTADGRYLVSTGLDKTIKLWDLKNLKEIKSIKVDTVHANTKSVITSDGKYLVTYSGMDKKIIIWDVKTSSKINEIDTPVLGSLSEIYITPDNKRIIVAFVNGIGIYNLVKAKEISIINDIIPFKLSNTSGDGKYIAAWNLNARKIFLYDLNLKQAVRSLNNVVEKRELNNLEVITSMILSKDAKYLYTATNSGIITKWDTDNSKVMSRFIGGQKNVLSLSLSNDEKLLLSGDDNGFVQIWDTVTGENMKSLTFDSKQILNINVIPKSSTAVISLGSELIMLNYITGTLVKKPNYQSKWTGVAISKNEQNIFTTKSDESIHYYSFSDNKRKELFSKKISKGLFGTLAIANNQLTAATLSKESISIWDIASQQKIDNINVSYLYNAVPDVNALAISKDGNTLLTGYRSKQHIDIIDLKSKLKRKISLNLNDGYSQHMPFSIALGDDSKYIIVGAMSLALPAKIGNSILVFNFKTGKFIKAFENKHLGTVYALSISEDSKLVASASDDNSLRVWERESGEELVKLKGEAVNIRSMHFSDDNKYITSIGLDGAIRYWDVKAKKEVLATYTFDNGEYISITPDGYFDSSKNATKNISIQTGPMEVSSIDQYYETFYRPDIVASVMNNKKDIQYAMQTPTLKLSDVKQAPQVAIINTQKSINKEDLKVTLRITPNTGGIGQIRLYLDGVLVKTDGDRALKMKSKESVLKSYSIKLPKGDHTIKAVVYNEANTMASREDTLAVTSTYNSITKPNIYAVVIGINEYKNPSIALKYAVADAKLFAKTIKKKTKGLYGDVKVELLTSKAQTSKENITKTLKKMENISPNDLFIFFVASHGMVEDSKYHMITSNVGALSSRGIKREAISQNSLRDMIANIPTTKKFIVLDTCNSGALGQTLEVALLTRGLKETTAMKVLSRAVGSTIISASSSTQEALEGYKGHGLLTYILTDGLKGKADSDRDGYIKTLEIANFVEDTVPEIAEKEFKRAQYPFISPLGQGFPLVKVK